MVDLDFNIWTGNRQDVMEMYFFSLNKAILSEGRWWMSLENEGRLAVES